MSHVKEGSIIHTDMWKGYGSITLQTGLQHKTVNHSKHYKDPITNVHTNYIEGSNNGLKTRIPVRARPCEEIDDHLMELSGAGRMKERISGKPSSMQYERSITIFSKIIPISAFTGAGGRQCISTTSSSIKQ